MRVSARAALALAVIAGAAVEVWAVRSGWFWVSAAFDLLAGWSLLAAAGWAEYATSGCRALLALSGVAWFAATPQLVGGSIGHDAALLGGLWLAPLATALLGCPEPLPARNSQRVVAAAIWVRALPALAGVTWLTALVGVSLALVALLDVRRYRVRVPRIAAVVIGVVLGVSGLVDTVASRAATIEDVVALSVAAAGIALVAIRPVRAATESGFAGFVVELGQTTDARSLERRLAIAVGDPQLRLLYQLAPGLPYVSASGAPIGTTAAGRVVTVMGHEGQVVAALEHDHDSLQDPQLREAVLAVGALSVRRLMRASEAAQQTIELAESRRRLVEAEGVAREQFATDVADGPDRSLASCMAALDAALAAAPPSLQAEVAAALAASHTAREELTRTANGDVAQMLAGRGLGAALLELAESVGAVADVRIDSNIESDAALLAWFAASEALTNALKHAGPARLWLSVVADESQLRVEVTDDGVGGANPDSQGLSRLRGRLADQGARLKIADGTQGGTRVVAKIPL
jgi:signal transduction histidine kinase